MLKLLSRLCAGLAASLPVAALFVSHTAVGATEPPLAETTLGSVVGRWVDTATAIASFKGIPYALAPVGERRWRLAEPIRPWLEPLQAVRFGPECMQASTMDVKAHPEKDFFYHAPSLTSEDCLYLNVWTPAVSASAKLPVMVWIHGGGEVQGAGSWPLYDGTALARKNVVIVTLNYRLGIFGRFATSDLARETSDDSAGAYDLSDIAEALRWVRDNIEAFGGDRGNVTLFGESSGALYIAMLIASPAAGGLFHKAIGESGGAFYDHITTLAEAKNAGESFVRSNGALSLAQLRALPAAELLRRARAANYYINPLVDGHFLVRAPCDVFRRGEQLRVPLLVGFNADERFGWTPLSDLDPGPVTTYRNFRKVAVDALAGYGNDTLAHAFPDLLPREKWSPERSRALLRGYLKMGWEVESWASLTARTDTPTYLYYFNHAPAGAPSAFHTAEVSYVFNNEKDTPRYSPNMPALPARPTDLAMADIISDYWTAFARTGAPTVAGRPVWHTYGGAKGRRFMEFAGGTARSGPNFFPYMKFTSVCEVSK